MDQLSPAGQAKLALDQHEELLTLLKPSEDWTEVEEAVRRMRAKTNEMKAILSNFL